ncbi:MAG: relaxase/mobilization nuclease domain-containing protein [Bacteroidaceae bacterium]|nr:relaxase/mobilization nuclease domain-containing protein [Bacteroidaceae bacterium]
MAIVNFVGCQRSQTVGGLNGVINYCCQKSKTDYQGRQLISGVNCVPQFALQEFMNTKRLHKNTDGRMYYHMIQSFHPGEPLTPEEAHEIALKLAEEIPGHEIVVATHTDRLHIHTHFIINSVSCETGKKYHSNLESLNALRTASDKLCKQYGLSVVRPKQKKKEHRMNDREYRAYDKGDSWKMDLEICIDECMTMARDREHFLKLMEWSGYGVRWTKDRKYITYTTPDGHRCRDIKLNGRKYHKEVMEYEFRIRKKICRRHAGSTEGYASQSRSGAAYSGSDGTELEGYHCFTKRTGRYAGQHHGNDGNPDHQRGVGGLYEPATPSPDGTLQSNNSDHGGIPRGDDALSRERGAEMPSSGDFDGETGWEREREIFASTLQSDHTHETADQALLPDRHDPQSYTTSLGTGAAYLAADLWELMDEDEPVEDCTTMPYHSERKKHHGPVMGGM